MKRKLTELENLVLQIKQAKPAAERHRVVEETTIRHLMNYREQEPRRLDEEIEERKKQAERRLAADERRIAELIHLQQIAVPDKATMLEEWAESLEIDPAVKSLPIHPGDELDPPAAVRQSGLKLSHFLWWITPWSRASLFKSQGCARWVGLRSRARWWHYAAIRTARIKPNMIVASAMSASAMLTAGRTCLWCRGRKKPPPCAGAVQRS